MPDLDLPDLEEVAPLPPPPGPGTWHHQVPFELRRHLVLKVIRAMMPHENDENDINGRREETLNRLIRLAVAVENECFQTAVDREDYYSQLAEAIVAEQRRQRGLEVRPAN